MERVRPDFSTRMHVDGTDETYMLDCRYDFIRLFPWLGYGVVNVVTDEGVNRMYTSEEQCRLIHERAEIPMVELEWITESEHERIIGIMADNLDDSWLA